MNNNIHNKIWFVEGKINVKAKGYWFTLGGEKGSFGYYPHLKEMENDKEYPIYPDTQIIGDLRMACNWLEELNNNYSGLCKEIFGIGSDSSDKPQRKKIFVSDLCLTKKSKEIWNNSFFQIKPRIYIDDEKRVVKSNMLVLLETAYLEGFELEANIFMGYFDTEGKCVGAKKFLERASKLLSGFGAFRSRGYGRGDININLEVKCVEYNKNESYTEHQNLQCIIKLINFTNFRNREIDPAKTQLLISNPYITSVQFKSWLANAYYKLFKTWPTMEQINSINISDFLPSWGDKVCYVPPMTTMVVAGGKKIVDFLNRENKSEENFFETKPKALSNNIVVTNEEDFKIKKVNIEKRIRNSIEDDFITKQKDGLFVQELIRSGETFATYFYLKNDDEDFKNKVFFILKNIKPIINGAVFNVSFKNCDYNKDIEHSENIPKLVVSPIIIDAQSELFNFNAVNYTEKDRWITKENANIIKLTSLQGYNTTLKRPKRKKIVISKGSVLFTKSYVNETIEWKGFGKTIEYQRHKIEGSKVEKDKDSKVFFEDVKDILKDLSRSHIGFLRTLSEQDINLIRNIAKDRKEKYLRKNKKSLEKLYEQILSKNSEDDVKKLIHYLIEEWNVFNFKKTEK